VLARLVPKPEDGGPPEVVYAARDITARIRAEQALSLSENSMRAITDNIPAMIARLDRDQRYTFANAYIGRVFGIDPATMMGRTMLDVRGEEFHANFKPHIEAAMRGETESFEIASSVGDRLFYFQSNLVPDRDADGNVCGFFALTFDITKLKLAEAKLDRLARIDSLTGVSNRRHFEERLAAALARSRRQGEALALLWLDIDQFKSINDNHGHPVGDAVIIEFARRVLGCVRQNDLVARIGGDEFVLLIEAPERESGEIVAKKLLIAMQDPVIVDGITLNVTTSIGVAFSPQPASTKALMDLADRALYAAKSAGRNTYHTAEEPW
jgi:diguanylate cyclase (GGDEF)-like protein/PAS domain S-box-containing protein